MGYFPVRYDSRVVIYDRRGFIRLATGLDFAKKIEYVVICSVPNKRILNPNH